MTGPIETTMRRQRLAAALAAAGLWLMLAGAAGAQENAASPMEQARQTDQILKQLTSEARTAAHATATTTASTGRGHAATLKAADATSATTATHGGPVAQAGARPTSATMIVRRPRPAPPAAAMRGAVRIPPVPHFVMTALPGAELSRLLTSPVAPLTTATRAGAIPRVNSAWLSPAAAAGPPPPVPSAARLAGAAKVRVNTADAAELRAGLGLDGARARAVVEFRTLYGRFKRPEDLAQVSGLTEEMVRQWDDQDILVFE